MCRELSRKRKWKPRLQINIKSVRLLGHQLRRRQQHLDDYLVSVAVFTSSKNILEYHRATVGELFRRSESPRGPGSPGRKDMSYKDWENSESGGGSGKLVVNPMLRRLASESTIRAALPLEQRYKDLQKGVSIGTEETSRADFVRIRLLDASVAPAARLTRSFARVDSGDTDEDVDTKKGYQDDLNRFADEENHKRWKIIGEVQVPLKDILSRQKANALQWVQLGVRNQKKNGENKD